jgi:hypothetical protein
MSVPLIRWLLWLSNDSADQFSIKLHFLIIVGGSVIAMEEEEGGVTITAAATNLDGILVAYVLGGIKRRGKC